MQSLTIIEFVYMIGIDLMFVAVLIFLMLPLGIYRQAAFAVMKRNFVGYFSNPTGYVFLCLFVLLTSFAAFWPHEFFTTNLANFDQLNKFLPYIMLVFIPAITMSIWAEERQQKTDELLLTLPAQDLDIVIGKYFAAVLVFTVSLIFSQLSNYAVLISMTGGRLDTGLLFATYLGYWFIGVAMLALGMVASFLTNNLTVSFIFGIVLNAPLAFLSNADVIFSRNSIVNTLYEWSLLQRFEPFGRGLLSPASIVFFLGIVVVGIYISLVLISRRHWLGGRDGNSLLWHFVLRSVSLVIAAIAAVLVVEHSPLNRMRLDVSQENISTLSPQTIKLLEEVSQTDGDQQQPIVIDAYVSNRVPTDFVQTRNDLLNLLREIGVRGKPRIDVRIHPPVEPYSQEAIEAEQRFGIRPQRVVSETRGALREEEVILGVALSRGLERVVIPFFSYGMSVESELMRAISKLSPGRRKQIGIVVTDAYLNGAVQIVEGRRQPIPRKRIVAELEKQYDVSDVLLNEMPDLWVVDENGQRTRRLYDVLLVAQPSKISPQEMGYLLNILKDGQPTVIFEDPYVLSNDFPSREFPNPNDSRQTQRLTLGTVFSRFLPRFETTEKADVQQLWDLLGIQVSGATQAEMQFVPNIAWSRYNPYPRNQLLNKPELVVVHDDVEASKAVFNREFAGTAGLTELVFDHAGIISQRPGSQTEFEPLVLATDAGQINLLTLIQLQSRAVSQAARLQVEQMLDQRRGNPDSTYVLAAKISSSQAAGEASQLNCIYVTDTDILSDRWVEIRNRPNQGGVGYQIENTQFVLNLVDALAGEPDYIAIRDRKLRHVTLRYVEQTIEEALENVNNATQAFEKASATQISQAEEEKRKRLQGLQRELMEMNQQYQAGEEIDTALYQKKMELFQQRLGEEDQKIVALQNQLQNQRQESLRSFRLKAEEEIQRVQRQYKLAAVLIPPIPPLLVGLFVFTRRRLREREGISKARRLK